MGRNVFCYNDNITEFVIHDNMTHVGYQCFMRCENLSKLTIGEQVNNIDSMAFYGCSSLSEIIAKGSKAPTVNYAAFDGVKNNGKVYYPQGSDYSKWENDNDLSGWEFISQ